MDKCGHHNNRHYYFPVKIAIYYNFILNFCHNYTDNEGPVMTTPTREELIIMYFFKGYPYKLIVEFYSWHYAVQETAQKNSQNYGSQEKWTTNSIV